MIWFTAITAAEHTEATRSENYLTGVRAMVLSALRNSPSLVPVVVYLGGRKSDCFVRWLRAKGSYVMVADRLSFMNILPEHATDHSSASLANWGAFAILDVPRFWQHFWQHAGQSLPGQVERNYALFTDADMMFTGDVSPSMNLGTGEGAWPPKLVAVLSERWWPHVVREGFNTAAYYLNVSAFADLAVPSMLRFAIDKGWRFSEGLRDQGLLNDFFRAYSNSPGPHRNELLDKKLRPIELHPYLGWRPYGGASMEGRVSEAGKVKETLKLTELLAESHSRGLGDNPRIWHFHGAKIWEFRCYMAELALSRDPGRVRLGQAGTAHCHGIKLSSHHGFMQSSLGNPHIYVSPCALLNYAKLLDHLDRLLFPLTDAALAAPAGTTKKAPPLGGTTHQHEAGGAPGAAVVPLSRSEEDTGVYLWAIEKLRKQVIQLGGRPAVDLPTRP